METVVKSGYCPEDPTQMPIPLSVSFVLVPLNENPVIAFHYPCAIPSPSRFIREEIGNMNFLDLSIDSGSDIAAEDFLTDKKRSAFIVNLSKEDSNNRSLRTKASLKSNTPTTYKNERASLLNYEPQNKSVFSLFPQHHTIASFFDVKQTSKNLKSPSLADENMGFFDEKVELTVGTIHGIPRDYFAKLLTPHPSLYGEKMELSIGNLLFLGFPILLLDHNDTPDLKDEYKSKITAINIVFSFERESWNSSSKFKSHMMLKYNQLSKAIAESFKHEENRVQYLSLQFLSGSHAVLADISSSVDWTKLDACNVLMKTVQALQSHSKRSLMILINTWLSLEINFQHSLEQNTASNIRAKPYQTFLINQGDKAPAKDLLFNMSPIFVEFLYLANPFRSFEEMAITLSCAVDAVIHVAHLLQYWGFGKIVDVISKANVYVVNPNADINREVTQNKFENFTSSFVAGYWNFYGLLVNFSKPKSLEHHEKLFAGRAKILEEFRACLVWLLSNDLLVQQKTYVYYSPESMDKADEDSGQEFNLLDRLLPYFNGSYSLEEIMWNENISRDQLMDLISHNPNLTVCNTIRKT